MILCIIVNHKCAYRSTRNLCRMFAIANNMAAVRNFEVISHRFDIVIVCDSDSRAHELVCSFC